MSHRRPQRWSAECMLDHHGSTHLFISQKAVESLSADPLYVDINKVFTKFMPLWAAGLFDSDHLNPYYDCGSYASHFYDPDTHLSYCGDEGLTAFTETVYFYNAALQFWGQGKYNECFYALGVSMHFLTDLTQPMHTNNFTQKSSPFLFHASFENLVMAKGPTEWLSGKGALAYANPALGWAHASVSDFAQSVAVYSKSMLALIVNKGVSDAYDNEDPAWEAMVQPYVTQLLQFSQGILAMFLLNFVEEAEKMTGKGTFAAALNQTPLNRKELDAYAKAYGAEMCKVNPDRCNGSVFAKCFLQAGHTHVETPRHALKLKNRKFEPCMEIPPLEMCGDDTGNYLLKGCMADSDCDSNYVVVLGDTGSTCNPHLCGDSSMCQTEGLGTDLLITTCTNPEAPQCITDADCDPTTGESTDPNRSGQNCKFIFSASDRQYWCATPSRQCTHDSECEVFAGEEGACVSSTGASYKCKGGNILGGWCNCSREEPSDVVDYRGN